MNHFDKLHLMYTMVHLRQKITSLPYRVCTVRTFYITYELTIFQQKEKILF